jgi:hypothetical protein
MLRGIIWPMAFVRTYRDEFDRREAASMHLRNARRRAKRIWRKVLEYWESPAELKEFMAQLEKDCGTPIKLLLNPRPLKNLNNWRNRKKRNSLPEHLRPYYGTAHWYDGKDNLTEDDLPYIPTRADIRLLEKFIPAWNE